MKKLPQRTDKEMNIRAARAEHLDRFTIHSDNAVHAQPYEPTPPGILEDMLIEIDADLSEFVFVDVGSGKGRMLCLASAHPFKRIIGIEFAAELHAIAQENLARFRAPWRRVRDVRSILGDACDLEWPREPLVLFLFNPFHAPVLGRLVENLELSWSAYPRPVHVLYYMPEHEEVLARSSCFRLTGRAKYWAVYGSREE